jgi:hypothetical protein
LGAAAVTAATSAAAAAAPSRVAGWLAHRSDPEQGRDGSQLLMMIVGDKRLGELRRLTDQQVNGSRKGARRRAGRVSDEQHCVQHAV